MLTGHYAWEGEGMRTRTRRLMQRKHESGKKKHTHSQRSQTTINVIPGADGLKPQMNYVHTLNLEAEESHLTQCRVPPPQEGEK